MAKKRRVVKFSFDSDLDIEEFRTYAAHRGMTLSGYAKYACYAYRAKYPDKRQTPGPADPVAVQQARLGGNSYGT
jgi:hypothetical protein